MTKAQTPIIVVGWTDKLDAVPSNQGFVELKNLTALINSTVESDSEPYAVSVVPMPADDGTPGFLVSMASHFDEDKTKKVREAFGKRVEEMDL